MICGCRGRGAISRLFRFFTLDDVMDDREINAELESIRAWEFGKGAWEADKPSPLAGAFVISSGAKRSREISINVSFIC